MTEIGTAMSSVTPSETRQYEESERTPQTPVARRAALRQLKDSDDARLIIVQGPAGFGKTTLLRQYCEYRADLGDGVAWIRMDAHSFDPAEFVRLVIEAVESLLQPGNARAGYRLAEDGAFSVQYLGRLLQGLQQRILIVVDNFEQAAGPGLEGTFSQVVRLLNSRVRLCVGTRVMPSSKLSRLRVQGDTVVIGEEELRFRLPETQEFFREFRHLPPEDVEEIHRRTDGWPAALQCFRLCLRRGRSQRSVAYAGKGVTPELIDYLASEVFEHLSTPQQRLLLDLCIPERLCPALVEQLSGCDDGYERLIEIEQMGLFLTHVDSDRSWYRFHNLFRQFLQSRLRSALSVEALRERHLRVARWYALNGAGEDAIHHFLEAGEEDEAAALFESVVERLIAQERLGLVERYADRLPMETLLRYETLAHAAVIAYGFRRAFSKADRLIEQLGKQLERDNAPIERVAVFNYVRLFVLAAQDRVQELGEAGIEAANQLAPDDRARFAITCNARALWYLGRADFESARSLLMQARPLHDEAGSLFGQAYQEALTGSVLTAQGRIDDAVRGLEQALHRTEEASGSFIAGPAIAAYLAEGYYEQNRLAEAGGLINDYAEIVEQQAIGDAYAVTALTMARLAFLRGQTAEAEDVLERVLYMGYRHDLRRIVVYARAELVRQATFVGDLNLAESRWNSFEHDARLAPGDQLLFVAGETEAYGVTRARLLIGTERHAEARSLLQSELRKAKLQRRRRRELKLTMLLAMSLNIEGKQNAARRACIEALEIGSAGGFVRSFLDERQPMIQLLKEVRQGLPELPQSDGLLAYLDGLLHQAGESVLPELIAEERATLEGLPLLPESLTERERYILQHVAKGLSNRDLADRLCVSVNTVKWHLRNIFDKLQITNRVQAISVARHYGLID